VDLIWIGKASNLEVSSTHHAALFTELIFNYGDGFQVKGENVEHMVNKEDHHIISGLKTEPFQTQIYGMYGSIGLILKPYCYGMLIDQFGTQAMERVSEILYETLFDCKEPNFIKVEQHLLTLFRRPQLDVDLLKFEQYISRKLLEKGALSDFNLSISISQKSFIQKFKRHYLLTPSNYIKLKKVNAAIQLLQKNSGDKLIDIGLDAGFYDQSHFIKIFKKFCGQKPKEFRKFEGG